MKIKYKDVRYSSLENWKTRRKDKKTEEYWNRKAAKDPLNTWKLYQKEWNFIETDYSEAPSNNGLDLCNPAFAFDKKLVKYLRHKMCDITEDGQLVNIRYVD